MKERSALIAWVRSEVVGPSIPLSDPQIITFQDRTFADSVAMRRGSLSWRPTDTDDLQEILYFDRETPHRKFGTGLLHPAGASSQVPPDIAAATSTDTIGVDIEPETEAPDGPEDTDSESDIQGEGTDPSDDFEVTSSDIRYPSTIGISFCVAATDTSEIVIRLPQKKLFAWAAPETSPVQVNGRYESCKRVSVAEDGSVRESPMWRRQPAVLPSTEVTVKCARLQPGKVHRETIEMPAGSPLRLVVEVFPRAVRTDPGVLLVTLVLRNASKADDKAEPREKVLYQTFFEVSVRNGSFAQYPESARPFDQLDEEEQSLALLYRESATWAIGHGCAAGWDSEPGTRPDTLYADVMPAVELPSMTPDISDINGSPLTLSMRAMAFLPDVPEGPAWDSLSALAREYERWISARMEDSSKLSIHFQVVAKRHLQLCSECLARIQSGIARLKTDGNLRHAFRLANQAMLLQQIATKQLTKRPLGWDDDRQLVSPAEPSISPWTIFETETESKEIGSWRAFQIAFLLLSIGGIVDDHSSDREIVDLIWFPTGGGKTEAYLAVISLYMFHLRLVHKSNEPLRCDGTNVFMRYTLRMLTTQQFQRAASLICAMEVLRRRSLVGPIPIDGRRFSLGLWIGSTGSPNNIAAARLELSAFRSEKSAGNPMVLTECPWCRSEIGRYDGKRPSKIKEKDWAARRIRGISNHPSEGPLLLCPDARCDFGSEDFQKWLPVEVIDQRIYGYPPSIVIATADKFAIIAYRPEAGALFGREEVDGVPSQTHLPPGLIIQDELHLISGPLGTVYGLYEGIIERLCSYDSGEKTVKPKLIASTATIRGAGDQVRSLYARVEPVSNEPNVRLFPSPGLFMGDSFFGTYAKDNRNRLRAGRLYLGIHANDYGSVLTAQVRAFAAVLCRTYLLPADKRDPWWTLLVFYNSIRELSGAKTLFDADIRSRLKFLFNRENFPPEARRNLKIVEELTSRLSQSEIVEMMDRLTVKYTETGSALDACLASSIIEVGVDIDRLSLMGVVGQPKTTAQYIQVTGRVGRRWWERPGLIMMVYNPSKSRDRSHFEQFHSYHRRLYERVEPTSATPFALAAIQRALPGALILWARQQSRAAVQDSGSYAEHIDDIDRLLRERCAVVQAPEDQTRSLAEMDRVRKDLEDKWQENPQAWEEFPPSVQGEYLMLWPGQFATLLQKQRGVVVPSSMRQVDGSAELSITQAYSLDYQE
jgi:hypothetical protein